jgi:hypothetical protein
MTVKLVTTSVVRGSSQGDSHGGVYLVDLDERTVDQVIDWNTVDIDWQGRGADRGLRGIAFDGDTIYIAASDELFAYDPSFKQVGSWRSPHLKYCHEIAVYERNLYLTSTGYDSILAFDLDKQEFHWALHVDIQGFTFKGATYDPNGEDGPLLIDKMHINNVHPCAEGMYIGGSKTGGILHFNGKAIRMYAELPKGSHNARPFRNGVLFNDTDSDCVRYVTPDGAEDRKLDVSKYDSVQLLNVDVDDTRVARQGFGRGLCALSGHIIATGSSPATISIHDLEANETVLRVNLSMDIRNSIHGLEVWPYD